jgi:hypothetical protein
MENNHLSNALDSVNEKDAVSFKSALSQHLNNRLFTALQARKAEVAKEMIGEKSVVSEANVIAPSAPPTQGFAKKPDAFKVDPAKAKIEMQKAKSMVVANKAKMAAVDVKKNVLGPKELETMQKQIAAVADNSVDIGSLKPVPGGFEVKKAADGGLDPNQEKEYLMKTFNHNGKVVELKQVGLGFSRPIRAYIDGIRWNFFPSMGKAMEMTKEYIEMESGAAKKEEVQQDGQLTEKVDLDGRTKIVRDTVARIEQYRKLRSEKTKTATENKENKFAGIYDDGSGKGAFIPQPIDTGKQHPFFRKTVTEGVLDEFKSMFKKENITVREGDKEEYERFFKVAMKKFGISSPTDLKTPEQKKKFFDYVKKNYKGND